MNLVRFSILWTLVEVLKVALFSYDKESVPVKESQRYKEDVPVKEGQHYKEDVPRCSREPLGRLLAFLALQ